jgi:hypothetical protein
VLLPISDKLKAYHQVHGEGRYQIAGRRREAKLLRERKCKHDLKKELNNVYMIRTDEKKSIFIRFQFTERYHENEKLCSTIYNDFDGSIIASNFNTDLKHLSLHQKVDSKLLDKSSIGNLMAGLKANMLRISGEFKYFQMTGWLNAIFNDLGAPSLDQVIAWLFRNT